MTSRLQNILLGLFPRLDYTGPITGNSDVSTTFEEGCFFKYVPLNIKNDCYNFIPLESTLLRYLYNAAGANMTKEIYIPIYVPSNTITNCSSIITFFTLFRETCLTGNFKKVKYRDCIYIIGRGFIMDADYNLLFLFGHELLDEGYKNIKYGEKVIISNEHPLIVIDNTVFLKQEDPIIKYMFKNILPYYVENLIWDAVASRFSKLIIQVTNLKDCIVRPSKPEATISNLEELNDDIYKYLNSNTTYEY